MIKIQTKYKLIRGIGLVLTLFTFFQQGFSTTYYSKGGNWNDAMSWVTGSCSSTINAGMYPISGDTAVICGGNKIILEGNIICKKVDVVDGIISYSTAVSSFLYVQGGDLTIERNGKIEYTGTLGLIHNLFIDGNLSNKGQLNLRSDASNYVGLNFTGSIPSVVSAAGGTYHLAYLRMNKNIPAILVDMQDPALSKELTDGSKLVGHSSIDLNRGIFRHNNVEELDNIYQPGMTLNDPMVISENVTIEVFQGKMTIPINNTTYLRGNIRLAGGTLAVSTGLIGKGPTPYGLYYQGNQADITLQDKSNLFIAGAFKNDPMTPSSSVNFHMVMNSSMDVGVEKTTVETLKFTETSSFNMSFGRITIHNASSYTDPSVTTPTDFELMSNITNVSGGEVHFGGMYTIGSQRFRFTGCRQFPHMTIGRDVVSAIVVVPYTHMCQLTPQGWTFDVLSLKIGKDKTFDMMDDRTLSTHTVMRIMGARSENDSIGFYNDGTFIAHSSWVSFNGRYQYIAGNSITTFSSLQIDTDPFKPLDDFWSGPILKTNIMVSDTTRLFRNMNLNKQELKTGVSDSKPGYMAVDNISRGVFNGTLTRYLKRDKKFLKLNDELNDYAASDLPFYIVDIQTMRDFGGCSGVTMHLDRDNPGRLIRIAANTIPQSGGYISVTYKGYHEYSGNKMLIARCNYIDGGDQVNVIAGPNWRISAESKLSSGSYNISAKHFSLTVDDPDIQKLRLLQLNGDALSGVGSKGFNVGVAPYIGRQEFLIFGKVCFLYKYKSSYAGLVHVVRYSLSYAELNNSFYIATLADVNPATSSQQVSSLTFRFYNGKDPYPFPTLTSLDKASMTTMLSVLDANGMSIAPNPATRNNSITITLPADVKSKSIHLRLIDMHGQIVINQSMDSTSTASEDVVLNLQEYNLQPGIYMLLLTHDGKTWEKRLIIR